MFPYNPRGGQEEFMEFISKNIGDSAVCLNASTGFGKTPAILATLLPWVKKHKIIWAVRTGNETDRPIEELKIINEKLNKEFFGLSYRGKKDMCFLAQDIKMEGEMDYQDVSFLCNNRRKSCEYYYGLNSLDVEDFIDGPKLYSEILGLCRRKSVCPYFAQRELLPFVDVVSLSYNYIIHEGMSWSIRRLVPFDSSFLVVDEAHNLQSACGNLNSDRISLGTLTYALREIQNFDSLEARRVENFINRLRDELSKVLKEAPGKEMEFNPKEFLNALVRKIGLKMDTLTDILGAMNAYGVKVRRSQLDEGKNPRSSLFHLSNFWFSVLENLDIKGVAFIASKERDNLVLEMWDMRASEILRDKWKSFYGCVFCSGTLNPVNAFADTVGLEKYSGKSFHSPFDKNNIIACVTKGLTTKGEELSRKMAENYVEAIESFFEVVDANVAVFTSSYRIQNDLLNAGLKERVESKNRVFFVEREGMSGDASREVLDGFKDAAYREKHGVLCAPCTGRFAEGADFPGKELEGIFLVGIPFDRMSIKTKLYLKYYESLYGKNKGTYYAYVVPALRRASQSLGRALRSKEDRGIFVLGDERYSENRFLQLLPDYVRENLQIIETKNLGNNLKKNLKIIRKN
ncbi:MAG: ATP-dependent DNA helicase [Candidatus Jordarchaeum sp.]|uniref:ATP-dependent DNA helicase n=1 Tax=Candidatus Jordarchaeum sp. TaxID=2823881 RepID=UPI0040490294